MDYRRVVSHSMMTRKGRFPCLLLIATAAATAAAQQRPIPVKVVVVTMFEVGADTGDQPGELQYWVERDHLDRVYEMPAEPPDGQVYALNASLAEWAYEQSRVTKLDDSDKLKASRSHFDGEAAQRAPFVSLGDEISSSTFWHGKLMDAWAAEWVPYFTGGKGVFATAAMEDTGTLQSLTYLARAGRVDLNRVMVLRTVSNYDRQPRGLTAAESLAQQRVGAYAAYLPALEAAYRVGHAVVNELLTHWAQYEATNPAPKPSASQPISAQP
jgi:purine nucleoside permease